jgi:hypothetical protein
MSDHVRLCVYDEGGGAPPSAAFRVRLYDEAQNGDGRFVGWALGGDYAAVGATNLHRVRDGSFVWDESPPNVPEAQQVWDLSIDDFNNAFNDADTGSAVDSQYRGFLAADIAYLTAAVIFFDSLDIRGIIFFNFRNYTSGDEYVGETVYLAAELQAAGAANGGRPTVEAAPASDVKDDGAPFSQVPAAHKAWEFGPGWAAYRGNDIRLAGRPLAVLKVLAIAARQTATETALFEKVWPGEPVQGDTVRSAISDARKALREQLKSKVALPDNPIPTVERGQGRLAWRLALE